jgi:hypothetical protein
LLASQQAVAEDVGPGRDRLDGDALGVHGGDTEVQVPQLAEERPNERAVGEAQSLAGRVDLDVHPEAVGSGLDLLDQVTPNLVRVDVDAARLHQPQGW